MHILLSHDTSVVHFHLLLLTWLPLTTLSGSHPKIKEAMQSMEYNSNLARCAMAMMLCSPTMTPIEATGVNDTGCQ